MIPEKNSYQNSQTSAKQIAQESQNKYVESKGGKTPVITLDIGWDTEYVPLEDGTQDCVLATFSLPGYVDVTHPDIIYTRKENGKTGIAVAPPSRNLIGLPYQKWLESLIASFVKAFNLQDDKVVVNLIVFFSNAEIAHLLPNKDYIGELVEAKGKDYKDLKILPIQSSCVIKNLQVFSTKNLAINVLDARLLGGGGSLAKIGETLGYAKGDFDFDKHDAAWYLENDGRKFINYGIRDAEIALRWYEKFHDAAKSLTCRLIDSNIISDAKLLEKKYITAASVTDSLMKAKLEHDGVYKRYLDAVSYLKDYVHPSSFWNNNKGGLNKSTHGFEAKIVENCDVFDVNSAYATAIINSEFPLLKPKIKSFEEERVRTLKDVAREVDKWKYCDVIVSLVGLGENVPESKRILNMYDKDGDCVTAVSNSGIPQCFSHWEIQAQAQLTPNAKIVVDRYIYWSDHSLKKPRSLASFKELFVEIKSTRTDFKNEFGEKSPEQEVIKLIGNGGVGKLAQNKSNFNSELLIETFKENGNPNSIVKDNFNSKVYNPWLFRSVTAQVRVAVGMSLALSDGHMVVTDSVVCPHGRFKSSKQIAELIENKKINGDNYKQLTRVLNQFDWKKEYDDVHANIYKERDYYLFKIEDAKEKEIEIIENIECKLKKGVAVEKDFEEVDIPKIAKRGYHQDKKLNKREQALDFALLGNNRFSGKPIHQNAQRLIKFNDMLDGRGNLNQPYRIGGNSPGMGTYNLKYDCSSLKEFKHRKRLKEACRRKGYADQLHLAKENSKLLAKLEKTCENRSLGNYKTILSGDLRRALAWLQIAKDYSSRKLAELTGISKTVLNDWKRQLIETGLVKKIESMFKEVAEADIISAVKSSIAEASAFSLPPRG